MAHIRAKLRNRRPPKWQQQIPTWIAAEVEVYKEWLGTIGTLKMTDNHFSGCIPTGDQFATLTIRLTDLEVQICADFQWVIRDRLHSQQGLIWDRFRGHFLRSRGGDWICGGVLSSNLAVIFEHADPACTLPGSRQIDTTSSTRLQSQQRFFPRWKIG